MITSRLDDIGTHAIHFAGYMSIMKITPTFDGFMDSMRNVLYPHLGLIFATHNGSESLASLILELYHLWTLHDEDQWSSNDHMRLRRLYSRLVHWASCVPSSAQPIRSKLSLASKTTSDGHGHLLYSIHSYLDSYVAGVWNVQRMARLLTICLRSNSACDLTAEETRSLTEDAVNIADEIFLSTPFLLADDLHNFDGKAPVFEQMKEPGRLLGGFLLLHPLYAITQMSFVSNRVRDTSREWLEWIAQEMGIGQAKVMASVRISALLEIPIQCKTADLRLYRDNSSTKTIY
jgi:hypothetical protein